MRHLCVLTVLPAAVLFGADDEIGPPPPPSQPPKAVCAQPAFDWGTVFTGQEVTHTYVIRNQGGAELVIKDVQESCKCTAVEFPKTIPAGGEGGVTLKVETKEFQGPTVKQATVLSNDPVNPKIVLQFGGIVRDVARVSPRFPALKGILGGQQVTTEFLVDKATEVPIDAFTLSAPVPSVTVKIEETAKAAQYRVVVTTVPGLKTPNMTETITFKATAGGVTVPVAVRVNITLSPRVFVQPPWVIIRQSETEPWEKDPAKPLTRVLKVLGAPGVRFKVEKTEVEGGFFRADFAKAATENEYTVTLTITKRPSGSVQPARGKLVILTDDPVAKRIEVGVSAFFTVK